MSEPRLVVLFDLDLTLVDFKADRAVLAAALDAATGVEGLLARIVYAGRTDRWIINRAAELARLEGDGHFERYADVYGPLLEAGLAAEGPIAMPGAAALLEALAALPGTVVGLATGGMRANALRKLAQSGLAPYFQPVRGAFGDEHTDRVEVFRAAARDCEATGADRLVFVGDTVLDVRAAHALEAVAIGVATGHASFEELRDAGADAVLPDLLDTDAALRAISRAPESHEGAAGRL